VKVQNAPINLRASILSSVLSEHKNQLIQYLQPNVRLHLVSQSYLLCIAGMDEQMVKALEGILVYRNNRFITKLDDPPELVFYSSATKGLGKRENISRSRTDKLYGVITLTDTLNHHELNFSH